MASSAGEVQQTAVLGDLGAAGEIFDHRFRVRQPVLVVIPGGPPVQVRSEPHLVHHQPQPFL
jgi:hypothetical protein